MERAEGNGYSGRRLVAIAPSVAVVVREVPVPRPATFCGGIGGYRLAASASPKSLRVGDPLTLTLDIERGTGSGSLDLISAPDLTANPRIAADFEILDKSPTGRSGGEAKRFEYALRPKRAGVEIPRWQSRSLIPIPNRFRNSRPLQSPWTYRPQVVWMQATLSGRSPQPGPRRSNRGHRESFKT